MRFKFLLFTILLWGGAISAQDTINYLIITEYRGDNTNRTYLELTNMGDKPVQLNQFKIGWWGGGDQLDYVTGKTDEKDWWIPVDTLLPSGEAYVFAAVNEYGPRMFARGSDDYPEKLTQDKMWEYADFHVHLPEDGDSTDVVTEEFYKPFGSQWSGMNGFYIEQHLDNGDSLVVDQVLGMFTGENGQNLNRTEGDGYDVAGVERGSVTSYLIRKHGVKTGTLDFNSARGVGLDDSEWIPIPHYGGAWREPMWTVGNHGDYNLDSNTLESEKIEVDFENKTLLVPWGVRRGDDIMSHFVKKPGIGWEYIMGADADSLSHAVQTGDQLLIYVCGDNLDFAAFDIVAKEPAEFANTVVPRTDRGNGENWENTQIEDGYLGWPRITQHESGNDTIWGTRGGIPYATRVDSLFDRLDKPSNAEWEIIYASGITKPDLQHGDKLKIMAQDGSVKEYFISVNEYRPSSNALLSAITWPDIPEFYKGLFGWVGDTIPGFQPSVFNYNVEVPLSVDETPALVAKTSDVNAKLEVQRASSLSGTVENRTINFTVTAEDDTTITNPPYSVTLTKQKNPDNLQPYHAEPFISEVSNNVYWNNDGYVEIANPGNQPLNLSDYMIVGSSNPNPAVAIAETNELDWLNRYSKYIPGYKWQDQTDWVVEPYVAELDLSVNSVVSPGDVFVLGATRGAICREGYDWIVITEVDVEFMNNETDCHTFKNQWGEEVSGRGTPANKYRNSHIFLLKILNDSIKKGLKPATDPNDFQLLDVFGMGEQKKWEVGGVQVDPTVNIRRKPEIFKGNPVAGASFGVNSEEDVEWDWWTHKVWAKQGYGWPDRMTNLLQDLGKHFFYAPTQYMSTVNSLVYKVSEGYKSPQEIKGLTTGTIVSDFLDNILKNDSNQMLKVTSTADGSELLMGDMLTLNDTLTVLSADSTNVTKYVLEVTEEGLSSNAVLTSDKYTIDINQQPEAVSETESTVDNHNGTATISGFEYGTALQTIVANVTVPQGASMTVISGEGAYVPMTMLNFDTTYVTTTVNADTYFEVMAENGTTSIIYQLIPQSSESSAFVTSNVYSIAQRNLLIEYVPRGTNVQAFLSNLTPSLGASVKVIDKWGFVRTDGIVADDDKLVVTSEDETITTVYFISKLATQYVQESTYLAYVLSNVYAIDQVDYTIYGASGTADISQFYSRIEAAAGATAVVVDEDGNEKTTGDLDGTDMVKVTSADGKIVVTYTFGQLTGSEIYTDNQIQLYPNPTNGKLNVTGIEKGQRIQIYNSVGVAIIDVNVESNHKIINIDEHPVGLYLIVVSDKNQLLGKYKVIKN